MTREELLEEIDRNRKWLCDAGYTAYNIDVAFASIYRKVKELEQEPCEDWYDIPSSEMTLEQARQAVKDLRKKLAEHLEQKPCEDAVSRKAVLNLARDLDFSKVKGMEHYKHRCIEIEDVEELASVTPDLSSLREINEALTKRVQYLEKMERYATPATPAISEIDKFNDSVNRAAVLNLINENADGFKDYSQYEYLFDQVDKMPAAVPTRKNGGV